MKLSEIHLNPDNPRFIKDDSFKKLCQSLKDFPKMMALRPIIVDGEGMILGGNQRYRACLELGMKEIPDTWLRVASDLTPEEARRFIIEDNIAFGEWDYDLITSDWDISQLIDWGFTPPFDLIAAEEFGNKKQDGEAKENNCPKCGYTWK